MLDDHQLSACSMLNVIHRSMMIGLLIPLALASIAPISLDPLHPAAFIGPSLKLEPSSSSSSSHVSSSVIPKTSLRTSMAVAASAVPSSLTRTSNFITTNGNIQNDWVPGVNSPGKTRDLHIAGLFPVTGTGGWLGGQGCLPAARMALDDVNRDPNLLPGYRLVLHSNDSQCNPGLGLSQMFDLIYNKPTKLLMLGGCSMVCSTVAEAAKMWNLIVVGFGSSSPALSNRQRFPTFFRTHPSATIHNPTRVKLFRRFGWQRIAIILEAEEVFVETGKDLEKKCKDQDIEILTRVSFLQDPTDAVRSLVRQDARIIVGMFYGGSARRVLCEAYKHGLYGKRYVWWLIGWYEDNWYLPVPGLNCTKEQMLKVVQGHYTTEALMLNQDRQLTISGTDSQGWLERYNNVLRTETKYRDLTTKPEGYQEAPLAYDAIWAIALALNKTIQSLARRNQTLENFHYENKAVMEEIHKQLMSTSFLGVSGQVAFSDEGDRIAWTQIEQMIDGKYELLGFYDTQTDNLTWFQRERWLETGKPPPDRTIIVNTLRTVNAPLYISVVVISIIGIVWAFALIFFNYHFRQYRYIQMSNPVSNNLMLAGCILCLSCTSLFGLDGTRIPEAYFTVMCETRAWILSLGFSLFFGAMFSKTWHAYRLSTQNKHKKVNDNQIYLMVGAFCCIDAIILLIWHFQQPMVRRLEKFPREEPELTDEDMEIQPLLEHCEAAMTWYGAIYGYKGLLLLFGLFLAYETRSVKLKQLNDSRLVGMSIYNVAILCLITAPVSLVMSNQVNSHFAFVSLAIIFCCFLSMALIFVPKIVELVRRRPHTFGGMNGVFQETMTSKEEEERLTRLTQENEDLKSKIAEKEQQIEEVKKQIEVLSKKQLQQQKQKDTEEKQRKRKAVRIQEPNDEPMDRGGSNEGSAAPCGSQEPRHLEVGHQAHGHGHHGRGSADPDQMSDSGIASNRNSRPSEPSDFEFSESYL